MEIAKRRVGVMGRSQRSVAEQKMAKTLWFMVDIT